MESEPKRESRVSLPSPLLELILERLPLQDYLRFAGVCKSWRDIQRDHRHRNCTATRYELQIPWLMFPEKLRRLHNLRQRLFYNPSEQRYYRLSLRERHHCCGSSYGWLVLLRDVSSRYLYLVNAFTGYEMAIPGPTWKLRKVRDVVGILSSVPTDSDCILMLWNRNGGEYFCRVREKIWKRLNCYLIKKFTAVFSGGMFYMKTGHIGTAGSLALHLAVAHPPFVTPVERIRMVWGSSVAEPNGDKYLLESDGQLLLANVNWLYGYQYQVKSIEIYKADLSQKMWVRLDSLEDRVLFLCSGQSFSMSAAHVGVPGNHIYFAYNSRLIRANRYLSTLLVQYDYGSHQMTITELSCLEHRKLKIGPRWIISSMC